MTRRDRPPGAAGITLICGSALIVALAFVIPIVLGVL
jgi:hypothetical protein